LFTGYTGNLDANFATDAQLFATGSTLNNKINSLSGVSVLTFGDQFISGNKTFVNNINVSGIGIFNALDLNNIDVLSLSGVDISLTNGNVTLTNRPTVNGTGVVLSGELNTIIVNTGSLLNNKINSLSGYLNSQDIIFSGQTFNTGSRLDNKINSLSGYVNSQTTSVQVFNTGSILDNKINALSGYVNSQDNIFSGQTFNTGSILDNKINTLSGVSVLTFGNQNVNGVKTFNDGFATTYISGVSGSNLDIIGYSGEANTTNRSINIQAGHGAGGIANSAGSININAGNSFGGISNLGNISLRAGTGRGFFENAGNINLLAGVSPSYAGRVNINGNININPSTSPTPIASRTINIYRSGLGPTPDLGVLIDNNKVDVNNGMVLQVSGVNVTPSLYATSANLASTGSRLDNKINALSGYVTGITGTFGTLPENLYASGSTLDNKINFLSGFLNNNVVYATGNQTVLGQKTFSGTTTVIGHFAATSKSFLIDHPLDNSKKLQYASLEGPEHGVFVRGKTNENTINLPNYWSALVNENSISVNLTPINVYSNICVIDYNNTRVITSGNNGNYYFYTVYGERKDIPKLTVEF
jgi:hypothetical protein